MRNWKVQVGDQEMAVKGKAPKNALFAAFKDFTNEIDAQGVIIKLTPVASEKKEKKETPQTETPQTETPQTDEA